MTSRITAAAVALGFALMGAGAYMTKAAGQEEGTGRAARVLRTFELPPLSLTEFGYTAEELDTAESHGLLSTDRPGIGSGLAQLNGNHFVAVTDRGPNMDHYPVDSSCTPISGASSDGKTFPLPQFTPALVFFGAVGGDLRPSSIVNLVDRTLTPITGLTNDSSDDKAFPDPCSNTPLPFNPNGMDVEDVALLPNGMFIGVDENKPSIFVGDVATGVVQKRYTPSGKTLAGAGYDISDTLPAVLVNRRNNRGFEAVGLSADGRTAYTATQSPLGSTSSGSPYRDSRVVRILRFDVSDPLNAFVTGQFVLQLSAASEYPAGTRQRDLKLSAMAWLAEDRLLLLERSDETAKGGVRLIIADLQQATNIEGLAIAATLTPEDVSTDLSALGVAPVSTRVVFDEFETDVPRQFWTYKLEGMAILNRNEVAIINDNDFGILDAAAPTNVWVLRLGEPLR